MEREAESRLLEQLYASPRLRTYAGEIQARLDEEARKRRAFYEQIMDDDKAEFINGEIIYHSPVRFRHANASDSLHTLLNLYVRARRLGYVGHEKLLISLSRNDYEPDICFFGRDKADAFTPGQMHFPAPDLVVEVLSDSTESRDRGIKFEDYAAHGVAEYWLIDPEAETVEQYGLTPNGYDLLMKSKTGDLVSVAVAGFVIPVRAIFDADIHRAKIGARG